MTTNIPTESTAQTGAQQAASPNASQAATVVASQGQEMPEWFLSYKTENDLRLSNAEKAFRAKQSEVDRMKSADNKRSKADIDAEVTRAANYAGLTPEQSAAYRSNLINEEIQRQYFAEQSQNALPGNGAQAETAQTDLSTVLGIFGVTTGDPEVMNILRENDGDPLRVGSALKALTLSRATATISPPNMALNATPMGGTPIDSTAGVESMIAEYEKLQSKPTENASRLLHLKRELDAVNWGA